MTTNDLLMNDAKQLTKNDVKQMAINDNFGNDLLSTSDFKLFSPDIPFTRNFIKRENAFLARIF